MWASIVSVIWLTVAEPAPAPPPLVVLTPTPNVAPTIVALDWAESVTAPPTVTSV